MQQLSSSLGRYGTPHFSPHRQSTPESVRVFWVYSFTALIVAFIRWNFFIVFLLKDSKKRGKRIQYLISKHSIKSAFCYTCIPAGRGTQRQFSENICSEDDLRSRIFGTFVVKFLACNLLASPRIFEHLKPGITALFNGFLPWKGHLEFSIAFFLGENFEKVSFDPYDFRITSLSARKSKQMKHF